MTFSDILNVLHREFVYLWYYFDVQLRQIFKYYVIGIIIGSVISVFFKDMIHNLVRRLYGGSDGSDRMTFKGLLGLFVASILGIASPLCMYGTIPLAASFSKSGVRDDFLSAFMMSSILLNPQLIIYSVALGNKALIVRIISSFLCGVCAGVLIRLFTHKDNGFFNFTGFEEPKSHDTDPNPILRLLKNILRNIKATGPMFLLGILLSAVFQRYVPTDIMVKIFGNNEAFGVLMAATIGVPLYACGGGTIPLLKTWLSEGMSLGSATAFMITGPATKITNLGALKIVLGIRNFLIYLAFVMVFAFATGLMVNVIF